jgi:hypothetical protein
MLGALDQRAPRGASIALRLRDWCSLMPERRWLMGVEQRRAQPCWHHREALALSLY